ncbi:hypothetical protein NDU88_003862 [Pleurodeles waltl]|uniref:Uncharacterized protein n=1 Tax=Pleurodeles waltl TaxID=8319 RepID=A0AAV7VIB1_PLEWA|nr:hypothetical protein NDU88_003862 [Pleurodeles waltl]
MAGVRVTALIGHTCNRTLRCKPLFRDPWRPLSQLRNRGNQDLEQPGSMRPLEGVKILDLTRVLAGPFATMILADLGAEVIKVEKPGSGDDTRTWGPPFVGTESAYFLSINRNKKSIAVNLKHPKGTKIIRENPAVLPFRLWYSCTECG